MFRNLKLIQELKLDDTSKSRQQEMLLLAKQLTSQRHPGLINLLRH